MTWTKPKRVGPKTYVRVSQHEKKKKTWPQSKTKEFIWQYSRLPCLSVWWGIFFFSWAESRKSQSPSCWGMCNHAAGEENFLPLWHFRVLICGHRDSSFVLLSLAFFYLDVHWNYFRILFLLSKNPGARSTVDWTMPPLGRTAVLLLRLGWVRPNNEMELITPGPQLFRHVFLGVILVI